MDLTVYGRRPGKKAKAAAEAPPVGESTIELTGEAIRLIVALTGKVAVQNTAEKYPRILNRIAALWNRPLEAERCFDELLLVGRDARQGFPPSVLGELAALREHYRIRVLPPKPSDPWDHGFLR